MKSNVSQMLLVYKTWGYYSKFEPMKSMRIYYWYIKVPQCGYMGHGLRNITFYVQKHIAYRVVCHNFLLVRDKPLVAPASVKQVYFISTAIIPWFVPLRSEVWKDLNNSNLLHAQSGASHIDYISSLLNIVSKTELIWNISIVLTTKCLIYKSGMIWLWTKEVHLGLLVV